MKKSGYILAAAVAAVICQRVGAQNGSLNQTVQVTNVFEGKAAISKKPVSKVTVPDSLYKFDLNFDYSGFENPYKGNDEFNPFYTELDLAPMSDRGNKFYMKAGAGYHLAPTLDLSYTMVRGKGFNLGAYAENRSYLGKYWNIMSPAGSRYIYPNGKDTKGYDVATKAGINGRADWQNANLRFDVGYEGFQNSIDPGCIGTTVSQRNYNGADVTLAASSNSDLSSADGDTWQWNAVLGFSYGHDAHSLQKEKTAHENNARAGLSFAYSFRSGSALGVEADCDFTYGLYRYSPNDYSGYVLKVTPSYHYFGDRVRISAGLGLMFSDGKDGEKAVQNSNAFLLYPAIKFNWTAVKGYLDVYASSDADGSLYGSRQEALQYGFYLSNKSLALTKRFTADVGLRGNICDVFHYDLSGGYRTGYLTPVVRVVDSQSASLMPELFYDNLKDFFAKASFKADAGGFTFMGDVEYRYFLQRNDLAVAPPALRARLDACYDYIDRLAVYAGASYTSEYVAGAYTAPQYFSLHAGLRYFITHNVGLYLEGDNLLNNACQVIPLVARRGICISAGVVLNF